MPDIYVDPIVAAMPDAADYLRNFADTGHRVVILGEPPASLSDAPWIAGVDDLPEEPLAGSWLVTADPELCAGRRPPMMSILVGPRAAPSPRPAPRCDAEARDLSQAVLEILGREAMG
jgi:hypothetical protein